VKIGCHTFRATCITAYLEAGGTLENAQTMAGTKVRARRSFMIAQLMSSHSTKSNGLLYEQRRPEMQAARKIGARIVTHGRSVRFMLVGRTFCKVDADIASIGIGDLLTNSDRPVTR
jgi:hypothetical protein